MNIYHRVAYAWALVFLAVGISFAASPVGVTVFLTQTARALSLTGNLESSGGTLWHVLSLSLMAAVTVTAFVSARFPAEKGAYLALVVAKWVSTLGFAFLAVTKSSAWWVCAQGDGFVAVTLMLARWHDAKKALSPLMQVRYRSQRPFYEIFFAKVFISPDKAFWLRHTLRRGLRDESALWAIFFDGAVIKQEKLILPENSATKAQLGFDLVACGRSVGQTQTMRWDLQLIGDSLVASAVPWFVRCLGLTRSIYASRPQMQSAGTIYIGGEKIILSQAPAMVGHVFGARQALSWTWAHANVFDDGATAYFEGLSVHIHLLSKRRGPLSWFVFSVDGVQHEFSSLRCHRVSSHYNGQQEWQFSAENARALIAGTMTFVAEYQPAVLDYQDTDGSKRVCRNSALASAAIKFMDKKKGCERKFVATRKAMFEMVL